MPSDRTLRMNAYYATGQAVDTQSLDVANAKANAMEGMLSATDPNVAFGKISYTDEVAAYQKAGQYGVSNVGPAIDAAGVATTKPLTHAAWDLNGRLHTDISTWGPVGPGFSDAVNARGLAWRMLNTYKQAILAARQTVLQATQATLAARQAPPPQPVYSAATSSVQAAAQALLAAIRATSASGQPVVWTAARGQATAMWRPTYSFQQAYGHLKVDGIYGSQTAKALQAVVGPDAVAAASGPAAAVAGYGWIAGDDGSQPAAKLGRWVRENRTTAVLVLLTRAVAVMAMSGRR